MTVLYTTVPGDADSPGIGRKHAKAERNTAVDREKKIQTSKPLLHAHRLDSVCQAILECYRLLD